MPGFVSAPGMQLVAPCDALSRFQQVLPMDFQVK
jgi:hypothetical protein